MAISDNAREIRKYVFLHYKDGKYIWDIQLKLIGKSKAKNTEIYHMIYEDPDDNKLAYVIYISEKVYFGEEGWSENNITVSHMHKFYWSFAIDIYPITYVWFA